MTSLLATFPKAMRDRMYFGLLMCAGGCPAGCCGSDLPDSVVYRSSRRSVTMRCRHCGLLWTMTIHQIAKSARVKAERARARNADAEVVAMKTAVAQDFAEWSEHGVAETRGRTAA
jgi:hypothetical protein